MPPYQYHLLFLASTGVVQQNTSLRNSPQLNPWCRALEELIVAHLVYKLHTFHETRRFIAVFTKFHKCTLSWANYIQSIPTCNFLIFVLILPSHLYLGRLFRFRNYISHLSHAHSPKIQFSFSDISMKTEPIKETFYLSKSWVTFPRKTSSSQVGICFRR